MLLDETTERSNSQIREIEQAIAMLQENQQQEASVVNELMLESLYYRKQKLEKAID